MNMLGIGIPTVLQMLFLPVKTVIKANTARRAIMIQHFLGLHWKAEPFMSSITQTNKQTLLKFDNQFAHQYNFFHFQGIFLFFFFFLQQALMATVM